MIKVLVVDDSALMRKHLTDLFESEGDYTVRTARNGVEALTALDTFDPDVITLDINMPEMDGITCLARIMQQRPKPVLMVSSLTEEGAEATLQALSLGAIDFVHKPGGTISLSIDQIRREILVKARESVGARVRRSVGLRGRLRAERDRIAGRPDSGLRRAVSAAPRSGFGLVLVGVSTGGPGTLEEIIPVLPADFPWAVLIAQHMPGTFTTVYARRLDEMSEIRVVEAAHQMRIEPGTVYVAKGDADLVVSRRATGLIATPVPSSHAHVWHPSVARLVASAIDAVPVAQLIGVQLTGMGDDGAAEMARLNQLGGRTIAQDAETCVVFGMPNELIGRGGADRVLPDHRIAGQLVDWVMAPPQTLRSRRA